MNKQAALKELIASQVFVKNKDERIRDKERPDAWIFDFRRILMNGRAANLIADIFYEEYKEAYPFQLGTLEIAGVPLLTTLMNKFYQRGHTDINAFFIRKSRKKTGLMRMVEGEVNAGVKIILIDDIMNSGSSFWRQIEVLEQLGHKVDTVWSILRFREEEYYTRFKNRCITIKSLFDLDDFTNLLGEQIHNLPPKQDKSLPMPFTPLWSFESPHPSLEWVVSKSQPIMDESKIYFGSDNRVFWALNQSDGSVAWQYQVGTHNKRKSIFSSPALYHNNVIFGAYDGNLYSLDAHTGKPNWIFMDADWIGSSPAVAEELGMVFVGMEYGFIAQRGGIVALDAATGKPLWTDRTHGGLTHASPAYLPGHQEVVIGSNDGILRLYDARSGAKKWSFTTFGGAHTSSTAITGFGKGDIKESCAYSDKYDYIIFGSIDGFLYILERSTGHLVHHHKCDFGIYSTPYIYKDRVYFTSVDKQLRCLSLDTFELVFEKNVDSTRIFSTPTVINNRLYVGTNAARLHELDPDTGNQLGYFQAVERITNTVIYNPKSELYYLPTFANEIIALRRNSDKN